MTKILIIDDSNAERSLYAAWLEEGNYEVAHAENAEAGIVSSVLQDVDCIVLDFLMEEMDGFQFLSKLRKTHRIQTPVIFLTGHDSREIEEDALGMGANLFLSKNNLSSDILNQAIQTVISA